MSPQLNTAIAVILILALFAGIVWHHIASAREFERRRDRERLVRAIGIAAVRQSLT